MATAPLQSCFQLLPIILLLLASATNHLIHAAEELQPMMIARPGCRDKCGNISIPFPFGMGPNRGCFREGFEVLCNDSASPPRAFLADSRTNQNVSEGSKSIDVEGGPITWHQDSAITTLPLELVGISVATGEARVYGAVSYDCLDRTAGFRSLLFEYQNTSFSDTPFALSATRNAVIGVGWGVEPQVHFQPASWGSGISSLQTHVSCTADPIVNQLSAINGSCSGRGCCEGILPLPREVGPLKYVDVSLKSNFNNFWFDNPCSYGMVVEKSWYNFSAPDLNDKELLITYPWGVPFVLEFAIGNAPCPAEGQQRPADYACISAYSYCDNATSDEGYICKCWEHYEGNPYITDGCQDIDECKLNPCSSNAVCTNTPGGYDCSCKAGMKGDGKAGTCKEIFPLVARVIVGAVGSVGFTIVTFLIILLKERRKMKEFYKKNGGPILEKAKLIKLFKKKELKQILKDSNIIGKGFFGEVYKGHLDNTEVAIKKPINAGVLENEQFANEVIIQSQVCHKNIVRLLGCCLEVDTPMLVYEFISKGSLHDVLHDNNSNNKVDLSLDLRLSIAAQSADGLAYMHSKTNTQILHGDVKPANILLDDNFVPKIADFGLSRLIVRDTKHTEFVIGDMNYMDPVYHKEGLLTEKSDVYSFGVVILELISRRKAIHRDTNNLVDSFREVHEKEKKATELFDKEIAVTEDLEVLNSLTEMAMECLRLEVDQRPTMTEVAERLFMMSRSRK